MSFKPPFARMREIHANIVRDAKVVMTSIPQAQPVAAVVEPVVEVTPEPVVKVVAAQVVEPVVEVTLEPVAEAPVVEEAPVAEAPVVEEAAKKAAKKGKKTAE